MFASEFRRRNRAARVWPASPRPKIARTVGQQDRPMRSGAGMRERALTPVPLPNASRGNSGAWIVSGSNCVCPGDAPSVCVEGSAHQSPMEVNPGIPPGHFDLVLSIYGLGWTTNLLASMELVACYLRPGGSFLVAGVRSRSIAAWNGNGERYTVSDPRIFTKALRNTHRGRVLPIGDPSSYLGHLIGQMSERVTDRGVGGNAAQSGVGDGRSHARSRALVFSPGKR